MELTVQDKARLDNYEVYESLYNNKVSDQLKKLSDVDALVYLAVNLAKTIASVTPDFLFGTQPRVTGTKQDLIDQIMTTTNFNSNMYRSALTSTVKGDAVIKLYLKDSMVKMQVIQPDFFYPIYDPYGDLIEATIVSIIEEGSKQYMLKEENTMTSIKRKLYELDDKKNQGKELPLTVLKSTQSMLPEETNPINMITVVHISNFLGLNSNKWGVSDYAGEKDLFLALNKRLSEIDYIISKHADPKIQVPKGMLENPQYTILEMAGTNKILSSDIDHKDFKVIEVEDGGAEVKYVQPDLSGLQQAFEELDRIINYILMDTETSPSLLTINKDGGQAESGKALRFRLMNTLRKINRKRTFYSEAIKNIFIIAQKLLNQEPEIVDVEFIDTITFDLDEIIDRAIKLRGAGLITLDETLAQCFPNTSKATVDNMMVELINENLRNNPKKIDVNSID